jgi:hypothetical protein
MSKLVDYSYMKYSANPNLFISSNEKRVNQILKQCLNDAEIIIDGYKGALKDAEERASQAEDELKDTKEAFGILCAEEENVKRELETLQLATNKWTYDIILATTLLFCILAFTYMIMIYNEYQSELCLY